MTSQGIRAALRQVVALATLALVALLPGCNGDALVVSEGGIVGTGAAVLAVRGPITSFGNGTVNVGGRDIALDKAVVRINDAPASAADLRVGMVVDVSATLAANGTGNASAATIAYRADAQGVADGVDRNARSFTLLGQTVRTDGNTVFDGGTIDTVLTQFVEVSGFRATPGDVLATRVQISPTAPGTAADVTGTVAGLDTAARTFALGTMTVDYRGVPLVNVPSQLANGAVVQVRGTQTIGTATLAAQSIAIVNTSVNAVDGAQVDIEGTIASYAGVGSFTVNGQAVDARSATISGGTADTLGNGVRVEAVGRLVAGVVVASAVRIEATPTLAVDGLVASLSTTAGTIAVGSQVFATTPSTTYEDRSSAANRNLSLASLAVGDRVTITATTSPALVASKILRLDLAAPPPTAPNTTYEGTVTDYVSASDFKVGGNRVNAASATFVGGVAASLANGRRVSATGQLSSGVLLASVVTYEDLTPSPPPSTSLSVEGTISSFVSLANFVVANQAVNASGASVSGGSASSLGNGSRVQVQGTLVNGVLVAQAVEIESSTTTTTAEVEGPITSYTSISSFVIAGQRIDATRASIRNGSASDLAVGRVAHVTGSVVGGVLVATVVELGDLQEIEVEGAISNYVSVASFVVAGRQVDASAATFEEGTAQRLANGVLVAVHGTLAGTVIRATSVEFK